MPTKKTDEVTCPECGAKAVGFGADEAMERHIEQHHPKDAKDKK